LKPSSFTARCSLYFQELQPIKQQHRSLSTFNRLNGAYHHTRNISQPQWLHTSAITPTITTTATLSAASPLCSTSLHSSSSLSSSLPTLPSLSLLATVGSTSTLQGFHIIAPAHNHHSHHPLSEPQPKLRLLVQLHNHNVAMSIQV
jgi:hypothetical protein